MKFLLLAVILSGCATLKSAARECSAAELVQAGSILGDAMTSLRTDDWQTSLTSLGTRVGSDLLDCALQKLLMPEPTSRLPQDFRLLQERAKAYRAHRHS